MSREPEHAGDEMPFAQPREMRFERAQILPLRAPADPPDYLLSVPFISLRCGPLRCGPSSVGGTRRIPLLGALPSEPVHDHIWEWNSVRSSWPALIGWDTTHSLIWRAAKRTGS